MSPRRDVVSSVSVPVAAFRGRAGSNHAPITQHIMSTATESAVLITGNTYPVREQLKALGGQWDAGAKGWRVPAARVTEARALVAGAAPVW